VVDFIAVLSDANFSTLSRFFLSILLCWHLGKLTVRSLEKGEIAIAMVYNMYSCLWIYYIVGGFQELRDPGDDIPRKQFATVLHLYFAIGFILFVKRYFSSPSFWIAGLAFQVTLLPHASHVHA
jgi:hypothetical protein